MMGRGQPTKYKPEYCERLIEHMKEGYSFEAFAAVVNVCEDTLYEWAKVQPDFSEAKKQAFSQSRYTWETNGMGSDMNPTIWIFNMKNRFPKQWRDRQEVKQETEHSISDDQVDLLADKLSEVFKLIDK